jgi:hypothetical protein
MENNISRSREGKDQKSDQSQTRAVSRSNEKSFNVISRQATLNNLQQRGVGGQAHELEQVRKGKMLALTDGKDEKPTSGKSHPTEKIILPDKGLLGGGNDIRKTVVSEFHSSERQIGRDVVQLGKLIQDRRKNKKAEQRQKEFFDHLNKLKDEKSKLRDLAFDDFKRDFPNHADYKLFNQYKKSHMEGYDREINEMHRLGPEGWHAMKKYERRNSNQGTSTSRS